LWFKSHSKKERTSMSSIVNKYIMELKNNKEFKLKPRNVLSTKTN